MKRGAMIPKRTEAGGENTRGIGTRVLSLIHTLWTAVKRSREDDVPRLSAALAFYAVMSLAPLLIVVIGVAGFLWGEGTAHDAAMTGMQRFLGARQAETVGRLLDAARRPGQGIPAAVVAVAATLFAATRVFACLRDAFHRIWGSGRRQALRQRVADRAAALAMVLGAGIVFTLIIAVQSLLAAATAWIRDFFPGVRPLSLMGDPILSFLLAGVFFAVLYRVVPAVSVPLRHIWPGALFAAVLFVAGKSLFSLYLSTSLTASAYGAAASLLVLLLWTYYSFQVLLLGFEVARVHAPRG